MARTPKNKPKAPATLKGWSQIADFLGQSVSVAERWAHDGMPVKREGKFVVAKPEDLNLWVGRETGEPVQVATEQSDLSAELKRGLAHIRGQKSKRKCVPAQKGTISPCEV